MGAEAELVRRLSVERHDERRNRKRQGLLCNIHDPKKSVVSFVQLLADFLVRDDHEIALHDLVQHRQGRMGRARVGRAPVKHTHCFRLAHVGDIDDGETAVPVTDVKPIASSYRMMAAVVGAVPRGLLAAGQPLSGHPPAAHFFRFLGIF